MPIGKKGSSNPMGLKKLWTRLKNEERGAICVGCGLTVDGGLLIAEISDDGCNGLTCRADGLYVPCPDSIIGSAGVGAVGWTESFLIESPNTYEFISECTDTDTTDCVVGGGGFQFQLCNILCCTARGTWDVQVYGGLITGASADFNAIASLSVSIDNGAYVLASPITAFRMYGAAGATHDISNMEDVNFLELASVGSAGDCVTFSGKVTVQVLAGSATWSTEPTFEFHWQLHQVGCC
jgi:hypothetical protein